MKDYTVDASIAHRGVWLVLYKWCKLYIHVHVVHTCTCTYLYDSIGWARTKDRILVQEIRIVVRFPSDVIFGIFIELEKHLNQCYQETGGLGGEVVCTAMNSQYMNIVYSILRPVSE